MNIEAVAEHMRTLDTLVREQRVMIAQLATTIASFDGRLLQVEAAMAAQRITNLGRGPTKLD